MDLEHWGLSKSVSNLEVAEREPIAGLPDVFLDVKKWFDWKPVFWIRFRILRIHVFFGLLDPDPLVRGMDPDPALDPEPDPSIIMQK